mmetsp:Transcript_91134/g.266811  ORF Transcript_91134/g.266811 Transcript_91134/m.266811 type:complete len:226 (-) Transcript_91134:1513-2190(-)
MLASWEKGLLLHVPEVLEPRPVGGEEHAGAQAHEQTTEGSEDRQPDVARALHDVICNLVVEPVVHVRGSAQLSQKIDQRVFKQPHEPAHLQQSSSDPKESMRFALQSVLWWQKVDLGLQSPSPRTKLRASTAGRPSTFAKSSRHEEPGDCKDSGSQSKASHGTKDIRIQQLLLLLLVHGIDGMRARLQQRDHVLRHHGHLAIAAGIHEREDIKPLPQPGLICYAI